MLAARHNHAVANLQVKNFPDHLHRRLRQYAQKQHRTISDIAVAAIEREVVRQEWHEKFLQRPFTDRGSKADVKK
jgi:predicted transcriptional regulator